MEEIPQIFLGFCAEEKGDTNPAQAYAPDFINKVYSDVRV